MALLTLALIGSAFITAALVASKSSNKSLEPIDDSSNLLTNGKPDPTKVRFAISIYGDASGTGIKTVGVLTSGGTKSPIAIGENISVLMAYFSQKGISISTLDIPISQATTNQVLSLLQNPENKAKVINSAPSGSPIANTILITDINGNILSIYSIKQNRLIPLSLIVGQITIIPLSRLQFL